MTRETEPLFNDESQGEDSVLAMILFFKFDGNLGCTVQVGNGNYNETYTYDNTTGNLSNKAGVGYTYNDSAHKHAVTHLNSTQKQWYDANGNMTRKIDGSNTFDLL